MPMYYKSSTGTWQLVNTPYIKIAGVWTPATAVYMKNGGVWQQGYSGDTTPPLRPAVEGVQPVNTDSPFRFQIFVQKSTEAGQQRLRFAAKPTTFPTSPSDISGTLINTTAGYSGDFSWPAANISSTTLTYVGDWYPGSGATIGTTYCFSWWTEDTAGNTSVTATSGSTVFPNPNPTLAAYLYPTYSASYSPGFNEWRDNFVPPDYAVYQGGSSLHQGYYFYNGVIEKLLDGKTVTKMQIFIHRINTAHGVNGAANVTLMPHAYTNRPSFNPAPPITHVTVGLSQLNRGQGKWFDVPSQWWQPLAHGGTGSDYRGLGLYTGTPGVTNVNYLIASQWDAGTASGRMYVEYHN